MDDRKLTVLPAADARDELQDVRLLLAARLLANRTSKDVEEDQEVAPEWEDTSKTTSIRPETHV